MMKILSRTLYTLILAFLFIGCDDDAPAVFSGAGDFLVQNGDVTIAGTLFLPTGNGPHPVMIIVPGSGNDPRDANEPFAEIFTAQGFAVYNYDKRGVGESTGQIPSISAATSEVELDIRASDVLAIVDLLTKHIDIDRNKIGVVGSSQGAWVNSIIYDRSDDISFIVMISGGVASVGLSDHYDLLADDPALPIDELVALLDSFDGLHGFNPISIVENIAVPILWIYGGMDRSHPAIYDNQVLVGLNKPNFDILLYPNANHDLENAVTGELEADLVPQFIDWLQLNIIN